jgi:uncharacterized protein YecE (DUF72 family)
MSRIRVGIGGWTYAPWRKTFYPADLPGARELEYASRAVDTIEINGTFYRTPSAAMLRRWHDAVPDDFVFSLKAPRYTTYRKELAPAIPLVERFLASGLAELGRKLGPILWQFPPSLAFVPDDLAAFLEALPDTIDGLRLRHALEFRHRTFRDERVAPLLAARGIATVLADADEYVRIEAATADFTYARLRRCRSEEPFGYSPEELDGFAREFGAKGGDGFIYMINGAKVRAPAAAMSLAERFRNGT